MGWASTSSAEISWKDITAVSQLTEKWYLGIGHRLVDCAEPSSAMSVSPHDEGKRDYDFCICCWKVISMNSAGRLTATNTVMRMMPSWMSSGVMVSPRPAG